MHCGLCFSVECQMSMCDGFRVYINWFSCMRVLAPCACVWIIVGSYIVIVSAVRYVCIAYWRSRLPRCFCYFRFPFRLWTSGKSWGRTSRHPTNSVEAVKVTPKDSGRICMNHFLFYCKHWFNQSCKLQIVSNEFYSRGLLRRINAAHRDWCTLCLKTIPDPYDTFK